MPVHSLWTGIQAAQRGGQIQGWPAGRAAGLGSRQGRRQPVASGRQERRLVGGRPSERPASDPRLACTQTRSKRGRVPSAQPPSACSSSASCETRILRAGSWPSANGIAMLMGGRPAGLLGAAAAAPLEQHAAPLPAGGGSSACDVWWLRAGALIVQCLQSASDAFQLLALAAAKRPTAVRPHPSGDARAPGR